MRPSLLLRTFVLCLLAPTLALAQGLRFTTLDVGQGDAAVLITPSGCVALFDGGPTNTGSIIKAYLRAQGVTRVDLAFVSHLHADHMGSMDEVEQGADGIPISAIYDHGGAFDSGAYDQYAAHFAGRRQKALKGQTFSLCNEVRLEVVASNGNGVVSSDENTKSVVVKISYGAFDALVGGDLTGSSPDIESTIAASVGEIELYKVHHHGSRFSSVDTFLAATKPLVSFISVGMNNIFGHPAPECISRLAAIGSDIWMTEDPAAGKKLGHIALASATGALFTVSQGSASFTYASKGAPPPDTQAPSAPGALVASAASMSTVDLAWSAATDNVGVVGYRVYRGTSGGAFVLAGTSSTPGFADLGLSASTTYSYHVTAVDAAGNESLASNTASVTTPAPQSVTAKVILNEILANESSEDASTEFIELVNVGGTGIDIGGWTLVDDLGTRHTFASGTRLEPGKAIVVFGGASGIPAGLGNAVASSTGSLGLNNAADRVILRDKWRRAVDSYAYASALAEVDGVSMNRGPDATAGAAFTLHTAGSLLSASPGMRANGGAF
jgi:beta-lactamase superfamily II metal-dependent hydrolase